MDLPALREGAEEMARQLCGALADDEWERRTRNEPRPRPPSWQRDPDVPNVRAFARILSDLTRPASRDFWARWLARHHGLTVGATAPVWQRIKGMDPSTVWSLSVRSDIDMDASPTVKVDQRGFVEPGAFPDSPIANVVSGISALTDPAAALRLAILAAAGRDDG